MKQAAAQDSAPGALITIAQAREAVERELQEFYNRQIAQAGKIDDNYRRLWDVSRQVALAGGKRLRPYLFLVAYQGAGGTHAAEATRVAAAVELLHIALLVHDDIIDRDQVRHGQPTTSGHYRKLYAGAQVADVPHYADGAALLAGDLDISGAYQLILQSGLPAEQQVSAATMLAQTIFDVAGGQLLDMEASLQPIMVPDSLKIALYKTASYSFVAPLRMGATLAGAPQATLQALSAYGTALGIAFQLADDMLGLFGNEAETGKSIRSDLAASKPTFLMQQAMANSDADARAELMALLGRADLTDAAVARARQLVEQSGARRETERRIASYVQTAHDAADQTGLQPDAIAALHDCVARATERRR